MFARALVLDSSGLSTEGMLHFLNINKEFMLRLTTIVAALNAVSRCTHTMHSAMQRGMLTDAFSGPQGQCNHSHACACVFCNVVWHHAGAT